MTADKSEQHRQLIDEMMADYTCIFYPMCYKARELLYCPKKAGLRECGDYRAVCTPAPVGQRFNSTELLLLANDEWKRREERKHNHPEGPWVAGFLNGFCTDKKWAREYVDKLLQGEKK